MYLSKPFVTLVFILFLACPALAQDNPRVIMETTKGSITVELNTAAAPITSANFLSYVKSGYYDNTVFHRVIKSFMVQGGGYTRDMQSKPTQPPIRNEADNGLPNVTGSIAMARTSAPHSATSQFFINVKDNAFLNYRSKTPAGWGYCVFGRVVAGMEVVHAIEKVPTTTVKGFGDVPIEPVLIKHMTLIDPPPQSSRPQKQ